MRVLYSVQPATGHLQPLVPLCRALLRRGHEVEVVCPRSFRETVESFGLPAVGAGLDWLRREPERYFPALSAIAPHRRYPWILTEVYAGEAARALLPDLRRLCEARAPDLILRDQMEFASWIVAESAGIPHVSYGYGLGFQERDRSLAAPALATLRSEAGLEPDDGLESLFRHMRLEFAPPAYRPPDSRPIAGTRHLRYEPVDDWDRAAKGPVAPTGRPLVVATLGNNYNRTPAVFETILAGLAGEPVDLVLLTGTNRAPEGLGPVPGNVRIASYIPLSRLLSGAAALICHGGFNTVMTAILAEVPMVLIPIDSDQPAAALRCRDLGIGELLEYEGLNPAGVREAVWRVVHEPGYREAAASLGAQAEALPDAAAAAGLIEAVARERCHGI